MDSEKLKRIEQRAYLFWEADGQPHGRHEEHWHRAARQVETEEDLREAYRALKEAGITIEATMNHESQQSIYVKDPDGNRVEIYWEFPDAVEIFQQGRSDENRPLRLED